MTIIDRKCFESGGFIYNARGGCEPLPREWAFLESDGHGGRLKPVTWDDVMAARRERQARRMDFLRSQDEEVRWVRISVQHYGYDLLGGWHAYIDAAGGDERGFSHWMRGDGLDVNRLMKWFPIPGADNFQTWKAMFAGKYYRGLFNQHSRGVVYCRARVCGSRVEELILTADSADNTDRNL